MNHFGRYLKGYKRQRWRQRQLDDSERVFSDWTNNYFDPAFYSTPDGYHVDYGNGYSEWVAPLAPRKVRRTYRSRAALPKYSKVLDRHVNYAESPQSLQPIQQPIVVGPAPNPAGNRHVQAVPAPDLDDSVSSNGSWILSSPDISDDEKDDAIIPDLSPIVHVDEKVPHVPRLNLLDMSAHASIPFPTITHEPSNMFEMKDEDVHVPLRQPPSTLHIEVVSESEDEHPISGGVDIAARTSKPLPVIPKQPMVRSRKKVKTTEELEREYNELQNKIEKQNLRKQKGDEKKREEEERDKVRSEQREEAEDRKKAKERKSLFYNYLDRKIRGEDLDHVIKYLGEEKKIYHPDDMRDEIRRDVLDQYAQILRDRTNEKKSQRNALRKRKAEELRTNEQKVVDEQKDEQKDENDGKVDDDILPLLPFMKDVIEKNGLAVANYVKLPPGVKDLTWQDRDDLMHKTYPDYMICDEKGDGHCMYHGMARQILGDASKHAEMRDEVIKAYTLAINDPLYKDDQYGKDIMISRINDIENYEDDLNHERQGTSYDLDAFSKYGTHSAITYYNQYNKETKEWEVKENKFIHDQTKPIIRLVHYGNHWKSFMPRSPIAQAVERSSIPDPIIVPVISDGPSSPPRSSNAPLEVVDEDVSNQISTQPDEDEMKKSAKIERLTKPAEDFFLKRIPTASSHKYLQKFKNAHNLAGVLPDDEEDDKVVEKLVKHMDKRKEKIPSHLWLAYHWKDLRDMDLYKDFKDIPLNRVYTSRPSGFLSTFFMDEPVDPDKSYLRSQMKKLSIQWKNNTARNYQFYDYTIIDRPKLTIMESVAQTTIPAPSIPKPDMVQQAVIDQNERLKNVMKPISMIESAIQSGNNMRKWQALQDEKKRKVEQERIRKENEEKIAEQKRKEAERQAEIDRRMAERERRLTKDEKYADAIRTHRGIATAEKDRDQRLTGIMRLVHVANREDDQIVDARMKVKNKFGKHDD